MHKGEAEQGGTDEGQQERDGILGQAGRGDTQERTYTDIQIINTDLKHNTETHLEREEETSCWWIWSKIMLHLDPGEQIKRLQAPRETVALIFAVFV